MAEGRRLGDVRVPFAAAIAALMSVAACVAILVLTRKFDFYFDEWDFVLGNPTWTLRDYFVPHSEHWSTIPAAIYRLLFLLNGARSYTLFMGALMVLHGAAALFLFLIVRRRAGDVLGILAAASLLLLGRGYENILWAFQIGFVGSVAYGLAAIWLLDADDVPWWRAALASAALLASLMSSGMGIPFCAAAAGLIAVDRARWPRIWVLVVPAAAYLEWEATLGRSGLESHRDPFTLVAIRQLVVFVPSGVGAVAAGLAGLSSQWAMIALAVTAVVIGAGWGRFGLRPAAVGALLGLLTMFAIVGLVRAQSGDGQAAAPRYVYVGSVLLLIVLADIAGHVRLRGVWAPAIAVVAILAIGLNATALRQAAHDKNQTFAVQTAELQTVWAMRDAPGMRRAAAVDPLLAPNLPIGRYIASREAEGSHLGPATREDLGGLDAAGVNEAMAQAFPTSLRGVLAAPPQGSCTAAAGRGPVSVTAREGSHVVIKTPRAGRITVRTWYAGAAPAKPYPGSADLISGEDVIVQLPDSGLGLTWHVQVATDDPADAPSICVAP